MSGAALEHELTLMQAGRAFFDYLIRHTPFRTLDHAWEMEDQDLTAKPA